MPFAAFSWLGVVVADACGSMGNSGFLGSFELFILIVLIGCAGQGLMLIELATLAVTRRWHSRFLWTFSVIVACDWSVGVFGISQAVAFPWAASWLTPILFFGLSAPFAWALYRRWVAWNFERSY